MTNFTIPKKILALCLAGGLLYASICLTTASASSPQHPFPQHVTYAPGTIWPNHRAQAQLDNDARTFYNYWKDKYLDEVPGNPTRYRILSNPKRTVSEGQGYGMIIIAIMAGHDPNAQAMFDGLWYFARDHPSNIDTRLMAWEIPEDAGGESSAFDGDADIAYGLLLAHAQWGSDGAVNYQAEARTVITAILESTIGPDSYLPTLGDWVNSNGSTYNQYTPRSSDFMPAHFRAYGRATGDTTWNDVVTATQGVVSHLQTHHSPNTGLLPDFIQPVSVTHHTPRPADPHFLEGAHDGHYYYNAGRDPWRMATDALLNNDPTSMTQTQRIADWIASATGGNPADIKAGYHLDGALLAESDYFTTLFVAPFGVALMTRPTQQQFLNDIYDAVYNAHEDYYEDSVTLLSLLVMSRNYWDPTVAASPGISFSGNWEQGLTGPGNWRYIDMMASDRFQQVTDTVRQGQYAVQIEVRPGDDPINSSGERAEVHVMTDVNDNRIDENESSGTQYYAFSVRLAPDWPPINPDIGTPWGIVLQLHGPDSLNTSPSFCVQVLDQFYIMLHSGNLDSHEDSLQWEFYPLSHSDLNPGQWIDFVIQIEFASDFTGAVHVWRRDEGQTDFTLALSVDNIPTLQYSSSQGEVGDHYWKHGFYRSEQVTITHVLWLDGLTRGNTFTAVVQAAFPVTHNKRVYLPVILKSQ